MKKSKMTAVMVLLSGAAILVSSSAIAVEVGDINGVHDYFGATRMVGIERKVRTPCTGLQSYIQLGRSMAQCEGRAWQRPDWHYPRCDYVWQRGPLDALMYSSTPTSSRSPRALSAGA